jgi:hypothetical protein
MKLKSAWKWEEISRNVHVATFASKGAKDEGWILLLSDVHWDNPKCDRKKLKRDLDLAVERDALIFSNGDFFCAMQGKYDRRSSKKDLRPEHQCNNYLDTLVETAADWLEPYKNNLVLLGQGNHETAIAKNHETDLLDRLASTLRSRGGITSLGGYSGYVRITCQLSGSNRDGIVYFYHHGPNAGGPVTKGVIGANRMSSYLTDAHIVHTGHSHDSWCFPIRRIRLTHHNKVQQETQMHVRTGGYKDEYGDGIGGWSIERGMPPKVQGGAWVRIYSEPCRERTFGFEVIPTR